MDEKAIRRAGYKAGEKNQKIEIAKRLKEMGMKIEEIVKVTELSEEEIKEL